MLAANNDTVKFDRAAFNEKYGVQPEQFVDVKALMGDSSDNIPGVAGIGEKTALKLISEYGDLDSLYNALPSATLTNSVNTKLINGKDSAFVSRTLAQICTSVPLDLTVNDIACRGLDREAAYSFFTKLELSSFIKKYALEGTKKTEENVSCDEKYEAVEYTCVSKLKAGYSVSYRDGVLYAFDGETLYRTSDAELKKSILANSFVCYDCKELYKSLEHDGIHIRNCEFDIMLGAYVVNPGESGYSLDKLVLRYLASSLTDDTEEAVYVYRIYPLIKEKLESDGTLKLLTEIELPCAATLADMELYGFKIDREGVEGYKLWLEERERELAERIYYTAGGEFNINSPKQLGEVLFERLGLPTGKKTKSGFSTDAETLERLRPYNDIIDDILDYRQVAKLRGTYADGLLRQADENGRIHTSFKQTGTATGRLSSAEPNLQNIPIKTELGKEFRRYFIPENSDYVLIDADYSQIELRILAHISGDETMISAFENGKDIHTSTASRIFGVEADEVTLQMRKRAKAVNFGILYGMGDFRLSNDLHIPIKEAKRYIESYLAGYPKIAAYLENVKAEARQNTYVTTIMGRRRYIPELAGKNKNLQNFGERVAMNSPIQGSAADIIKLAMINVSKKLEGLDARLILQVHDELLIEASKECADKAREILKTEMENAIRLRVPLEVDVLCGDNWYVK